MNSHYARLVTTAAFLATATALSLFGMKVYAWWYTGSVSLLASLVDSLVDIAASLVNLLVVRYSLQPADTEHTFGHGKAESLAALAQSMFISGSALFLLLTGAQHLITPQPLQGPELGMWITIIALVVTGLLVAFQRWVIRKTHSQAVRADMLHYQSDVLMNGAILLSLALSWKGVNWADAVFALGIGVYILGSALRMAYEAIQVLLDRALPDEERQEIVNIVSSWPGVSGAHQLRTRRSGPTRFIQLHLEMADNLPLVESHQIADELEQALLKRFPGSDVIIHQDPVSVVPQEQRGRWVL
ncbi:MULTISPECIES: CDF family cation-efflux transporter FieF [Dickeya]|uniref:Cation-efflux pump FieF n=1 Tax=Dickeya fangzhongdai TaxID=1778540 RepID=A0A2K8QU63_9GAMM|nr:MULTISPECIES: CDF family cation-efflux transporter FieF [Dickeya]ATZ96290.1 cation-efflux pump FieF [Dickeya fangzhongdai]AYH49945.1 cation-efflux pump FieF [Dickeya fangzhongdai]KHN53162.1 ferrous iron transporter [Dickeya fangzhongdai]MBO8135794.1 CDF family cation-efflux transporter FieF [Dickeya fangzhongdai]QOH49734.1 CDF family cation-efflux pump FieF [Dickeya fangzhongdai]